ncbi:hypothetical protein BCR44DRAFT_36860 [Catenaria anguillulae PL171]|uniref:Uncharacterized protein n=1 Tax=Catenaria anguillulae PL171 TaxID=765915 RepID=A0A1Y2HBT2_9FUNG|nr:hypothetical protein BCR44DRAFT_36860 [Catenaria anguillulae PL171]
MHHQTAVITIPIQVGTFPSTHVIILGGTSHSNTTTTESAGPTPMLPMEAASIFPKPDPPTLLTSTNFPQFPNSPDSRSVPIVIQSYYGLNLNHLVILSAGSSTGFGPFWLGAISFPRDNSTWNAATSLKSTTYIFPNDIFRDPSVVYRDQAQSETGTVVLRVFGGIVILLVLVAGAIYAYKKAHKPKSTADDTQDVQQTGGVSGADDVEAVVVQQHLAIQEYRSHRATDSEQEQRESVPPRPPAPAGGAVVEIEVDTSHRAVTIPVV